MARLARVIAVGAPHHITQRGNARRFILVSVRNFPIDSRVLISEALNDKRPLVFSGHDACDPRKAILMGTVSRRPSLASP
jgi:hypothetical protein